MSTPLTMPDTIAAALTWSGYCESSCFHALGRRGVGAIVPAEYVDGHDLSVVEAPGPPGVATTFLCLGVLASAVVATAGVQPV
jgi:hypothetical protein